MEATTEIDVSERGAIIKAVREARRRGKFKPRTRAEFEDELTAAHPEAKREDIIMAVFFGILFGVIEG